MQLVPLDMYRYALENAIEIARCLHVNCYGCTAISCMSCENKKCNHCLVQKMEVFLPVVYARTRPVGKLFEIYMTCLPIQVHDRLMRVKTFFPWLSTREVVKQLAPCNFYVEFSVGRGYVGTHVLRKPA